MLYARIFGFVYFVFALIGIFLSFYFKGFFRGFPILTPIGLMGLGFITLVSKSPKVMKGLNLIVFLLILRSMLHDIPIHFFVGMSYFSLFYFVIVITLVFHIFMISHPLFKNTLKGESKETVKITLTHRALPRVILLFFLLVYLVLFFVFTYINIDGINIKDHSIPFRNIQFILREDGVVIARSRYPFLWKMVDLGEYYYEILDKDNTTLSVLSPMRYDSEKGIVFGKAFQTTVGGRIFLSPKENL